MATLKLILDTRGRKERLKYPVKIRITVKRKAWYYHTEIYIASKFWNLQNGIVLNSYPNYKLINLKIRKVFLDVEEQLLELDRINPDYTIDDVKKLFAPTIEDQSTTESNIFVFGNQLVEQMRKANRIGNAQSYLSGLNSLKQYIQKDVCTFQELDYNFLCQWEAQLLSQGLKANSIAAYFKAIRVIYNRAIKSGIVGREYYPFNEYKIKTERTVQRTLTKTQILQIASLDLPQNTGIERARDLFMLSFYLIGMNFRDLSLLTSDHIHGDRIIYKRQKTHKIYSIKITSQAQQLINKYQRSNLPYLLPIISSKYFGDNVKEVYIAKEALKNYNNRHLKKIGALIGISHLTTYYARYSWANIARKLGYSKDLIAEALGHEYGNKVTGIYLDHYDLEIIDEMNCRVCEAN